MSVWRRWAVLGAFGLGSALAYVPVLDARLVDQAAQEGRALLSRESGYMLGPYLLASFNEGVRLQENSPEVDGIVVHTPYERVRYETYVAAYQGKTTDAAAVARRVSNRLTFQVYTHSPQSIEEELEQWQKAYGDTASPSGRERSYLDLYKGATLTVNGRTLQARADVDGPYRDQFTLPTGAGDFRFLGVVSYTFDLSGVGNASRATLRFTDSRGKAYTQDVDLSRLR